MQGMVAKLARVLYIFIYSLFGELGNNSGSQSLIRCIKQRKKKKTERTRIHRPTFRTFWYPSLHLIEDRPGSQKCLPSSFHKYMYLYNTLASFHTRNCYLSFWRGKVQKSRQYNIAPTAVLHNVCASHCSYCYHIGLTLITVSDIKSCDILSLF